MRCVVTICAAVLLVTAMALGQDSRHPLSDQDLDHVTAGQSQAPTGQANQESSAVVTNHSSATLSDSANVENSATGPATGKGLNIVSAAESDVANGLNVLDGLKGAVVEADIKSTQLNSVVQSSAPVGSVQSITGGGYIKDISQIISHNTQSSFSLSHDLSSTASSSFHFQNVVTEATVPGFNPFDSVIDLPKLGIPAFTLPGFSFGFDLTTGSEPTEFGVAASVGVGPINVDLGGIDLGKLDLTQDHVILHNPTIDAPSVSGSISGSGKVCFFECAKASGSATFNLDANDVLNAMGFHGFGDIDLGPNPFKDIKIQAGGGVAGVGSGTIDASAGSIGANINFELKWPDSLQSIDFKIPGFSIPLGDLGTIDVPGHDFGTVSLNIKPVDFTIPIIPTTSFGGFHLSSQNAAYCIASAGASCPVASATFIDSSSDSSQEEHSSSSSSASSGDQTTITEHQMLFPPTVGDTEGQFLVLGESTLSSQSNSSLKMSGTAQQGFHAVNLLNLSSTLMANGVNVSMTPVGTGFTLAQANNVLQSH